ncbi:MAG: hypothetical protein PHV32_11005 [Eubacteriales bacterium]|nr:hypothetical protein [Oscillospiraceae bacterium]MDD4494851.1 hypothetical protein [Eubacteriales bacterium]
MCKKRISILSIVLYVTAGLLAIYSIWAIINIQESLKNYLTQYQLAFKGNEFDIINSYVSGAGQYLLFAIVLAVLGYIVQVLSPAIEPVVSSEEQIINEEPVDEISVEEAVEQFEASTVPEDSTDN